VSDFAPRSCRGRTSTAQAGRKISKPRETGAWWRPISSTSPRRWAADGPIRLIALDTLLPGAEGGLVDRERIAWLDARLAEAPSKPTLIFMHHPPFKTGITYMDSIGLDNADALADVVRRHPQVERVVCGHLHRSIQSRWAGTVASTAPSTAHQIALDVREDAALGWTLEPPGYALHLWRPDVGLVSHVAAVGEFATYSLGLKVC
jgi:Icc protein